MDITSTLKLEREINVTELSGEKVMVDFETGKYYLIKGVGNDIWEMIREQMTVGQMIEKILNQYEVEREVCTKTVFDFLNSLTNTGLISVARE